MSWFFAVLVVLAVGAVAVVAARGEGHLGPAYADRPGLQLPEQPLTGDDLRGLRLDTAVRGYRADDVDALLARLADELDRRPPDVGPPGPVGPPD